MNNGCDSGSDGYLRKDRHAQDEIYCVLFVNSALCFPSIGIFPLVECEYQLVVIISFLFF